MMKDGVICLPNDNQLKLIKEELGETSERLKNRIQLINEWLKYQNHLPNEIDEKLLENFIRLCKFDIGKIKKKLDLYFISREKFKLFYENREMPREYLQKFYISKFMCYLPNLTENGCRMVLVQPKDIEDLNFYSVLKYGTILFDYLLHEDLSSGVVIIYDFKNVTASLMGKVDLIAMHNYFKMYIDVLPFRIKSIHILNLHPIAMPAVTILKAILAQKLKERLMVHKNFEDFYKEIPKNLLPVEIGGTNSTLEELSANWEILITENSKLKTKLEAIKLCGLVPNQEDYFKSYEYGADGSFRQLEID
ncbi:alpha-tocopherol transfer protein-like isoform X1 [Onthophagus taurus]|uniref:alpha-tocopherol transfer protein-like isoform X1 n=1 Tax=Onthophagus taurus TaxID=166361 RepID=UPI0039BE68A3